MPRFEISFSASIPTGFYSNEEECLDAYVDLTDEEVEQLIQLIREKKTRDIDDLELWKVYPDIYDKINEACHDVANEAVTDSLVYTGYLNEHFDYDIQEVKEYCKEHCGYVFERPTLEEFLEDYGDDEDYYEDFCEEREEEDFEEWLREYVEGLSFEDAVEFINKSMAPEVDVDDIDYTPNLPYEIVRMAFNGE